MILRLNIQAEHISSLIGRQLVVALISRIYRSNAWTSSKRAHCSQSAKHCSQLACLIPEYKMAGLKFGYLCVLILVSLG